MRRTCKMIEEVVIAEYKTVTVNPMPPEAPPITAEEEARTGE
jgi:hypothetical protein